MQFHAEQIDSLSERHFRERLIQVLSGIDPGAERELRAPAGLSQLDALIARARRYGLLAELDIGRFIVTAWLLGVDFDSRFPAMQEILTEPRLSPTQKADAIERLCTAVLDGLHQGATHE